MWISGAMEASEKSCPWSGGGEDQRGMTGDVEEGLMSPVRSLYLFQKALGKPWGGLSRRMAATDWPR